MVSIGKRKSGARTGGRYRVIIRKEIRFPKRVSTYITVFFVIVISLSFFGMVYEAEHLRSVDNRLSALSENIDQVSSQITSSESDDRSNDYENRYTEMYTSLSDRADEAINQVLEVVSLLAGLITLLGVLLAFKAPSDLEKKIDDVKAMTIETRKSMEEARYQAAIVDALAIEYNGQSTSRKKLDKINKVIKKYPNKDDAYLIRGYIYDNMATQSNNRNSERYLRLAIVDYEIAYNLGADEFKYCNNMGIAYSRLGNHEIAIDYYTRSIEINPRDPDVYVNRAGDYDDVGKRDEAFSDITKAIDIDNRCFSAYDVRSVIFEELADEHIGTANEKSYILKQIADLLRCSEIDPENQDVKSRLAEARERLKNIEQHGKRASCSS